MTVGFFFFKVFLILNANEHRNEQWWQEDMRLWTARGTLIREEKSWFLSALLIHSGHVRKVEVCEGRKEKRFCGFLAVKMTRLKRCATIRKGSRDALTILSITFRRVIPSKPWWNRIRWGGEWLEWMVSFHLKIIWNGQQIDLLQVAETGIAILNTVLSGIIAHTCWRTVRALPGPWRLHAGPNRKEKHKKDHDGRETVQSLNQVLSLHHQHFWDPVCSILMHWLWKVRNVIELRRGRMTEQQGIGRELDEGVMESSPSLRGSIYTRHHTKKETLGKQDWWEGCSFEAHHDSWYTASRVCHLNFHKYTVCNSQFATWFGDENQGDCAKKVWTWVLERADVGLPPPRIAGQAGWHLT
jgi:hypothetical protein